MAITVTKQTIIDGPRNLVVKVHLLGDSNEAAALLLINVSDYSSPTPGVGASVKVMRIVSALDNFHCTLLWDATTDVSFVDIPAGNHDQNFEDIGGLVNNAGTGITGDIMLTTNGIGVEEGTFTLHMKKRDI
jgi:hypothetical protein